MAGRETGTHTARVQRRQPAELLGGQHGRSQRARPRPDGGDAVEDPAGHLDRGRDVSGNSPVVLAEGQSRNARGGRRLPEEVLEHDRWVGRVRVQTQ